MPSQETSVCGGKARKKLQNICPRNPGAMSSHSPFLAPLLPMATTHWLSVFMDLPVLDISYECNHAACGLFDVASFTHHNVFRGHLCCSLCHCFIPFIQCIIFHHTDLHIMSAVPLDEHLGFFPTFWLLWRELPWIFMDGFLLGSLFSVFWGIYQGVEFLGHNGNSVFPFGGNVNSFFMAAVPFHILTNSVCSFQLLHILANTYYCLSVWLCPSKQMWSSISLQLLWFAFPWCLMVSIFNVLISLLCILHSLWRNVCLDLWPLFVIGLFVFSIWVRDPCRIYGLQISSPIIWVIFSVSWWCPLKHKCFYFLWSPIYLVFLWFLVSLV